MDFGRERFKLGGNAGNIEKQGAGGRTVGKESGGEKEFQME